MKKYYLGGYSLLGIGLTFILASVVWSVARGAPINDSTPWLVLPGEILVLAALYWFAFQKPPTPMPMVKNLVRDHLEEIEEYCRPLEEKGLTKRYDTYGIEYCGKGYTIDISCERYSYDETGIYVKFPTSYKNCGFSFSVFREYYRVCCEESYWSKHTLVDFTKLDVEREKRLLKQLYIMIDFLLEHFDRLTDVTYCEKRHWDLVYCFERYLQIVEQQSKNTGDS